MAAGNNRKPRRIQEALDVHGLNFSSLARQVGVRPQVAWRTVQGQANNRKVLSFLRGLGVDEDVLDLPPGFDGLPPAPPPAPAARMEGRA